MTETREPAGPQTPEAADAPPALMGGSILLAISRVWSQVASGLLFLATSIAITPTEFGEFAIATSIFSALAVFVGQGTYEYVIKARESDTAAPTVFFINLATAALASVAVFVISLIVPRLVEGPHIPQILHLLAPVFFLMGMSGLMESVIMKRGDIKSVGRTTIVADTVSLVLAMGSLFVGAGVFCLVVQRVVREFMIMAMYGVTQKWRPQIGFDMAEARHAVAFAKSIVGIRLISLGSTAVVDVAIGSILGAKEAGIYRLVARLLTIGSDILFQPFRAGLWVRLPPLQDDIAAFRKTNQSMLEVFGVGMFAVMVGMTLIAQPMFALFFKPEWQAAVPLVGVMAVGRLLYVPSMAAEVIFALRNKMTFLIQFSAISAVTTMAVSFATAPFGLTAFVLAGVALNFLQQLYILPPMTKCLEISLREYLGLFGRLALNGVCMAGVVLPLLELERRLGLHDWVQLSSGVLIGAGIYILATIRFTPTGFNAYAHGVAAGYAAGLRLLRRGR